MNFAKNMEAIFIAAVAIIGATGIATAAVPAAKMNQAVVQKIVTAPATTGDMQIVTVSAKRLTAAEKAAL